MMKKTLSLMCLLTFLVLGINLVSADIENFDLYINGAGDSSANPIVGSNSQTESFIVVINNSNDTIGSVNITWTGGSEYVILPESNIYPQGLSTLTMTLKMPDSSAQSYREIEAQLYNTSDNTLIGKESLRIYYNSSNSQAQEETFCDIEIGDLSISDFDINNLGEGSDDTWNLLDELEIEVEVKNNGNDDISDVMVELKITDNNGKDLTDDFDLDEEEIDLGKIRDGDKESVIFKIEELPADLETGTYRIYVKAYEDGNEDEQCASTSDDLNQDDLYYEFEVESEYDEPAIIALGGSMSSVLSVKAGDLVEISFNIYNLGDQDEERVLVMVENVELGLSKSTTFKNLDIGDKKQVTFTFTVPEDADEGKYKLNIYTYFDYDDGDVDDEFSYDSSSYDDLDEDFIINLDVLAMPKSSKPIIDASLSSEVKIGEELQIKAIITNTGDYEDFVVSVSDYESWAESVSVSPQTLTIETDETKEVMITVIPKTSGLQSLKINAIVGGETYTQSIGVNIPESSKWSFDFGENNLMVYLVSGIVILLILIIIVLIVRLSKGQNRKVEY